jgi:hypothetical protein
MAQDSDFNEPDGSGGQPDDTSPFDDGLFPMNRQQFAQAVIDRVRRKFPLVKIGRSRSEPFSVRLNGHVASLENLYRSSRINPGDLQYQIERWAVELLRAGEGTPDRQADLSEIGDRLLPMLLPVDTAGRDPAEAEPPGVQEAKKRAGIEALVSQPLIPGLSVGYAIDGDRTVAYVTWETMARWNLDIEHLHEKALGNLVGRSQAMNAHAAQDDEGEINLILFQSLDGYDASRLLLPNLHDRLRDHLGSPFVAAVPNRDILLCFRADEDTVEPLRGQIRHDYRNMPHQVTDRLVLITADGIAPYD